MINNNQKYEKSNSSINNIYTEQRKIIIQLIKIINKALNNASQTFYLSLYYMDLIFMNNNLEDIFKLFYENNENDLKKDINKKDLVMISLCCLIIATKFNENDPNVPNIISFVNLCSYYSYNKYIYKVEDLIKAEILVLKILEYKLNYFTLYHYFTFFFTHGFLFEKNIIKDKNQSKNEILEKIYVLSREVMDLFIEDYENIDFILGNNIYFTAIQILIWSTQHILNISYLKFYEEKKNIFELLYNIDYEKNKVNNESINNKIKKAFDNNNQKDKAIIYNDNKNNKENNIINKTNSKANNENHNYQHNNLLTSCDNYYLEKYKNKYNYLNQNLKIKNILNSNTKSNYISSLSKYKLIGKNNKGDSRTANNYKYIKLFQFGNNDNNMKNNRYNYSSSKKPNKEGKLPINFNNNIKILFDKYLNNNIDKNENNIMNLNYLYDKNINNKNEFHKMNDTKEINFSYYNKQQKNVEQIINEKDKDLVYKTKLILDIYSYPSLNNIKNNTENFNNKQSNFYYNKIYDTKINQIINDRYSSKENIQDNLSNNLYFNKFNNKSLDFIKGKIFLNENHNLNSNGIFNFKNKGAKTFKKYENKNNYYCPATYYQYDKINQYENIDKSCTIQKFRF